MKTQQPKKAQTTVFILLGILIFAVLAILITILAKNPLQNIQSAQALSRSEMQPIQDYIESCVEFVSEEAIDLIGRQGFALYSSQGGTIPGINPNDEGKTYLRYDGDAVTYRVNLFPENLISEDGKIIISNSKHASERFNDTRLLVYPWASYPYDPFTSAQTAYLSSGFGWNTLPPLNRIGPDSIEEQIEGYLAVRITKCTDWKNYPQFMITTGKPQAQVIFAQKNTLITIKWRVSLKDESGRSGVIENFVTSIPVRIATVHAFAKTMIDNDVNNITFDITSLKKPKSEFDVFLEQDSRGGSIIRIVDPHSTLYDRPYEARFARQNRPPALNRIDQEILNTPTDEYLLGNCANAIIRFDAIQSKFFVDTTNTSCAANIRIHLDALDPDEESVTYLVKGTRSLPHILTTADTQSIGACLPFTLVAFDGHDEDWQEINLRTKSTQFHQNCTSEI